MIVLIDQHKGNESTPGATDERDTGAVGEQNRDGAADNQSWNYGMEGETVACASGEMTLAGAASAVLTDR